MGNVEVTRDFEASATEVWAVLADYGGISAFNPNVESSYLLDGGPPRGQSALRQCNLADGKNHIRERVTEWNEGSSYTVEIYEGTMPLKSAYATLGVEPVGPHRSRAVMKMHYTPRFGPVGWLIDQLMMQGMMTRMGGNVLQGLETYVTTSNSNLKVVQ